MAKIPKRFKAIMISIFKTYSTAFILTLIPKIVQLVLKKRHGLVLISRTHFKAPIPIFMVQLFGGYQILESLGISAIKSRRLNSSKLHPKLKSFITRTSAIISGMVAFHYLPPYLQPDLALFALVRVLDSASVGNPIKKFSAPLFHLSSWIIMYSWFYYPSALPAKYTRWISKMARIDKNLINELMLIKFEQSSYKEGNSLPISLVKIVESFGVPKVDAERIMCPLPCKYAHRGIESCTKHTLDTLLKGFRDGIVVSYVNKIYGPLSVVWLLMRFKSQKSKGFVNTVTAAIISAVRSSLFLGSFIALIWAGICIGRNTFNPLDKPIGVLLATFIGGFAIHIEEKSRQHQLALYCIPKALEAIIRMKIPARYLDSKLSYLVQNMIFSFSLSILIEKHKRDKSSKLHNRIFKFCISEE